MNDHLTQILRQRFGFDAFRPGQLEALQALLDRGSLLCIQPTGHGKSLLYQLPAVLQEGLTLVVSPLLALMRDQLGQLEHRFGIPAASVNSDQEQQANLAAWAAAREGRLKILFVAPEQLDHVDRFAALLALPIDLLVVDEAHCISTWGHDFRPSYREIARLATALGERRPELRLLGLTATADERTAADIAAQLVLPGRPPAIERRSMDRPNIALGCLRAAGLAHKLGLLAGLLSVLDPPGLLYCSTRENTEIVAEYLQQQGLRVPAYHAGLPPDEKRALQQAFLDGGLDAIAATNALGMGIDKGDLRFVIHVDVPGSITAYYQEVGRCGRDGLPARGLLLYDPADRKVQDYFIHSARPAPDDFTRLLTLVEQAPEAPSLTALRSASGMHPTRVTVVVAELVEQGYLVKRSQSGRQIYLRGKQGGSPDLARYRNQETVRRAGLERMLAYADGQPACLMQALRVPLGDAEAEHCGRCSRCDPDGWRTLLEPAGRPQSAGQWLDARPVVLPGYRKQLAAGRALFDSHRRSPAFLEFMRRRTSSAPAPELLERLIRLARQLHEEQRFTALVLLPSHTWAGRLETGRTLAHALDLPLQADALAWAAAPPARQGELLNNDQRRENVDLRMVCAGVRPPRGPLLLLDDYSGCGATLREAARALIHAGADGPLVPLALARVQWRLGRSGIV